MSKTYFGYGERIPQITEAIIGRLPDHEPAALVGFNLGKLSVAEIQPNVRTILAVNRTEQEMDSLGVYAIAANAEAVVHGLIYRDIDEQEMALLDNWDVAGLWFERLEDSFVHIANRDGRRTLGRADAHFLPRSSGLAVVETSFEELFPPPISDLERTIELAILAREAFLAR